MDNKKLKEEIGKILVNNSMPTRQVAIGEIMALMDLQRKELAARIIEEIGSEITSEEIPDENFRESFNSALRRQKVYLKSKYLK